MKKRNKIKPHKDNIFLFPNVDRLLMDKGLESLKNKRYSEAVGFLEKSFELDEDNEEIGLGLIIAYFESGNLLKAKQLANHILQKGIGDYFQIIDIYIMILLQLNEYEEIVSTIEVLLEEREIPSEKLENFSRILDFSRRKLETNHTEVASISDDVEEGFDLLQLQSINEQFLAVAKLSERNVRSFLHGIKTYLSSPEGHPFIQTMLLLLLREQEVNEKIQVVKFKQTELINPSGLIAIEDLEETNQIKIRIKREMEQTNPILFENTISMIDRHSFLLYPFERYPNGPAIWAAAYHYLMLEYYGEMISVDEIVEIYHIEYGKLKDATTFIRELEEISSPII